MAAALFARDSVEKDYSTALHDAGDVIMDVCGINCEDWSLLKITTVLKIIWWPEEVYGPCEVNCTYYFVNVSPVA